MEVLRSPTTGPMTFPLLLTDLVGIAFFLVTRLQKPKVLGVDCTGLELPFETMELGVQDSLRC